MERFIVANWKMSQPEPSLEGYCNDLEKYLLEHREEGRHVVVFPSAYFLGCLQGHSYKEFSLGMQHFYPAAKGNFTGEISPSMAEGVGCSWLMVGHSERRTLFSLDEQMILQQLLYAFEQGYNVVFCIGESKEEYEASRRAEVLQKQLSVLEQACKKMQNSTLLIAYEPVWAIGTGLIPSIEDIETAWQIIEEYKVEKGLDSFSRKIYTLYGGSVNAQNATQILATSMQGLLIGGASLEISSFLSILK